MNKRILFYLPFLIMALACNNEDKAVSAALKSVNADDLKKILSVIASDDFMGRAPATQGEEKTINYLAREFDSIGLKPANGESFFQEVPLYKKYADPSMKISFIGEKNSFIPALSSEIVGGTPQISENVILDNSDMVFVGYGINSPENEWNDYEGVDVKGKTVLMLINDPGYATLDSTLFEGKSMTYEGRWTYKYEEAARQGASAAIIIHETGAAAYPWGVVQNGWNGSKFYLKDNLISKSPLLLQSWVTTDCAKNIFKLAGMDYDKSIASAAARGFKAIPMNVKVNALINSKTEYTVSHNVAAIIPGNGKSDEVVIYTAHWDHFGINPAFKGDSILNGAVDNATGTAALYSLAKAFLALPEKQNRSVMFLSVTCEEQGLLGSQYYTEHPLIPLNKTAAVINMDGLNILGPTKDMTVIGLGKSPLDSYILDVLKKRDRYAMPDPSPEKGNYFRSDHLSFVRAGVPALYPSKGVDYIGKGREWGIAESEKWINENYHKPSDNYEPEKWNFDGMVQDIRIFFETGYRICNK